jgi:hypothetical protein
LLPSCFATGVYAPVRAVARRLRSSSVRRLAGWLRLPAGLRRLAGWPARLHNVYERFSSAALLCRVGQQLAAARLRLDNPLIKQSIFGYLEPGVNHTKDTPSPTCGDLVISENGRGWRGVLAGFGGGWRGRPIAGNRCHFLLRRVVSVGWAVFRGSRCRAALLRLALRGGAPECNAQGCPARRVRTTRHSRRRPRYRGPEPAGKRPLPT